MSNSLSDETEKNRGPVFLSAYARLHVKDPTTGYSAVCSGYLPDTSLDGLDCEKVEPCDRVRWYDTTVKRRSGATAARD